MQSDALLRLNQAMARLADGDRGACAEVFAALWPELVRFARRVLGNDSDADDAAQVALEKIFSQASEYDETRSALAWALAILSWECRSLSKHRRRQALRHQHLDVDSLLSSNEPDPEQSLEEGRMMNALRETFQNLPDSDRGILERAFLEDVKGPQPPALRKRKERALLRLRTAWRKLYGA